MARQPTPLVAIAAHCSCAIILSCWVMSCESDSGSRNEVEPWPTEEAVAIHPDLRRPPDDAGVPDSGPPPPEELEWPELGQTYVLHSVEESVPFDDESLPDHFMELERFGFQFGFRIVGDWSERTDLGPGYHRLSQLRKEQTGYYIGTNLPEADGRLHLYQCDSQAEKRAYVRPAGYIGCVQAGSLWWRFRQEPNDLELVLSKCGSRLEPVPPIPEPWLGRYLQMIEGGMEEPPTGVPIRLLAFFPDLGLRAMTSSTKYKIGLDRTCRTKSLLPVINDTTITFHGGSP